MEIVSDAGNNQTLKLALASAFIDVPISFNLTKDGSSNLNGATLPVLKKPDEGLLLFSPNESCRYLLRKGGKDVSNIKIDEYLELDSTLLQPLVHHTACSAFGHGKADAKVVKQLEECLGHLNGDIGAREYFVGDCLSAADLVLWATLFPVLSKAAPNTGLKDKHTALLSWFQKLEEKPEFQAAVASITRGKLTEELQNSMIRRPCPLLPLEFSRKLTVGSEGVQASAQSQASVGGASSAGDAEVTNRAPVTAEEKSAARASWREDNTVKPKERVHPILPEAGAKNILITSALPYVNNVPHLGNIIGCVLSADVYSRFCRLRNYTVLYICGTDEYGTATETKAVEEGLTPRQICDKYNKLHDEIYRWFNIGFDYFGRTTTQQQTKIAQDIFWKLDKQGYILKDSIEQLLCEACNRFLADRFVEGTCPFCHYEDARGDQCDKCGKLINAIELRNPRCKMCSKTPVVKSSDHLFMDLPALEPLLQKHLDKAFREGLWSANTKQITNSWLRDGLKPRCITRDLKWGTPVPMEGYTDKVFYVWYDAPIGYISITANYTEHWEKWWKNPQQVQLINFMAKDNVPFHSVIFPSSQLGTGDNWTVVNHLSATEYLNYEDGKFSKSRGVGVFGNNAQDTGIPADIWRFYLLFLRPETQDSGFSWDDFMTKNNSELLNNLGNFINRALMFVANQFKGQIPEMDLCDEDVELLALITRELKLFIDNLEHIKLRDGIRNILSISKLGNQYIQANKPWVKVKGSDADKLRAGTVVGLAANIACLLSVMLQPYMPEVSDTIQTQLAAPSYCNVLTEAFVCTLKPGHTIGKPSPLFQKLEQKLMDELKSRFAGKQVQGSAAPDAKKPASETAPPTSGKVTASPEEIEKLTAQVTSQGLKVRELKTNKAEKSLIDQEVGTLLELKKALALAQGLDPNAPVAGAQKKTKGKKK